MEPRGISSTAAGRSVSSEHFVRGKVFTFLDRKFLRTYDVTYNHHFALLVCILFGLWNCLSILVGAVMCLVSGIIQICIGFIVLGVEAPFCCMFIDHVQTLSSKVEQRPLWNRAVVYCS